MRRFQFSLTAMLFLVAYVSLGMNLRVRNLNFLALFDNPMSSANVAYIFIYQMFWFCEVVILSFFLAKAIPVLTQQSPKNVFWLGSTVALIAIRITTLHWAWAEVKDIWLFLLQHPGAILQALMAGCVVQWVYSRSIDENGES